MNRKFVSRVILPILIIVELSFLFLTWMSYSNKDITEIKEENKVDKEMFSMYVEQEDGTYKEYTDSNYFTINGYVLDIEKSNCVDNKGNAVNGVLSKNDNKVTISSNKTSYCYLYFSLKLTAAQSLINIAGNDLWNSPLEGDGYRYIGTNPNNYICFGTTDKTTCTGNTDMYMYRIIGIFKDSEENEHLKLIKKEALNTGYEWHSSHTTDVDWDGSDLYKGINGDYFLDNGTYSYMQNSTWRDKIVEWNYTATNTLSYENYSANSVYGIYYYYNTPKSVYLHELNRSSKSSQTCRYNSSTTADCSAGEWKSSSDSAWDKSVVAESKIGLMYASDYSLSLGTTTLDLRMNSSSSRMKTGWMHLSNNDSETLSTTAVAPPSSNEWTMSRYGVNSSGNYFAWDVLSNGRLYNSGLTITHSVRPVFYLESDVEITGGTGTIDDPFLIS